MARDDFLGARVVHAAGVINLSVCVCVCVCVYMFLISLFNILENTPLCKCHHRTNATLYMLIIRRD